LARTYRGLIVGAVTNNPVVMYATGKQRVCETWKYSLGNSSKI